MATSAPSRRAFLRGAAGAAALSAVAALPALAQEPTAAADIPTSWDYEAEVVICGFGAAGAFAAREAILAGCSCIVLEKAPQEWAGAASTCFGGYYVPTQPEVTLASANGRLSEEEAAAISAETTACFQWMSACGMTTNDYCKVDGNGANFYNVLSNALLGCGANVLYEVGAKDLVIDPATKAVVGVRAVDASGQELTFKATRGVLIATGGVVENPQLLNALYLPSGIDVINVSSPYNTGDGLLMGLQANAALHNMSTQGLELGSLALTKASAEIGTGIYAGPTGANAGASIYVNGAAQRFMDEELTTIHYKGLLPWLEFPGNAMTGYQGFVNTPIYLIFDAQVCDTEPLINNMYVNGWNFAKKIYDWSDNNQAEIEKGWIAQGNTIEELVEQLAQQSGREPLDAEALKATIEAFNSGEDPFGRSSTLPINTPPYYAAELTMSLMYTIGGLTPNGKGQTLGWDGAPIAGLYHAGDVGQPVEVSPGGCIGASAYGALAGRALCTEPVRTIAGEAATVVEAPTAEQQQLAADGVFVPTEYNTPA